MLISAGMDMLKSRRQFILGIAVLVLLGTVLYGFFTKDTPVQPDHQNNYEGLVTQEEVEQDEVTRNYFLSRISMTQAALAAQQDAYGDDFDWDLYFDIAADANQIGDLVAQREAYEDLLALNPISYIAWGNYARVLTFMGDYDAAKEAHYKALELNASVQHFRDYIGFLQAYEPDSDQEILEMLKLGVEVHGQTRWFMAELAQWYMERGDCENALSHYKVAIANDPDSDALQLEYEEARDACR